MRGQIAELDEAIAHNGQDAAASELLETLRQVVSDAETQIASSEAVFQNLAEIGDRSEALKDSMFEMTRLEERLKAIIETCGTLVRRLRPKDKPAGE